MTDQFSGAVARLAAAPVVRNPQEHLVFSILQGEMHHGRLRMSSGIAKRLTGDTQQVLLRGLIASPRRSRHRQLELGRVALECSLTEFVKRLGKPSFLEIGGS